MNGGNQKLDVIRIQVGRKLIDDPNKRKSPIPDFWYGKPFVIEVEWVDPAEDLMLTLSEFRLVSAKLEYRHDGNPVWVEDPDFELELLNSKDKPISQISFAYSEAKPSHGKEGVLITAKTLTVNKSGSRADGQRHQLVFFKQTLSEVLFEIDPPWVGKPPIG